MREGEDIIVLLPTALGKEAILNDSTVAIVANLCCLVSRSVPALNLAENALLNFLSLIAAVTCTQFQN